MMFPVAHFSRLIHSYSAPNCVTFGGNKWGGIVNDNGIGPVVADGYLFER